MTNCIWEPLVEIEFSTVANNIQVYCLFSRSFVRNKVKNILQESLEQNTVLDKINPSSALIYSLEEQCTNSDSDENSRMSEKLNMVKVINCNCDNDGNVFFESANNCEEVKINPNKNSNSVSFKSQEKHDVSMQEEVLLVDSVRNIDSNIYTAWEKYWFTNGENIIWRSWIEKFGDYINPDYLSLQNFKCIDTDEKTLKSMSKPDTRQCFASNLTENINNSGMTYDLISNRKNIAQTTVSNLDSNFVYQDAKNNFSKSALHNDNSSINKETINEEVDNWWRKVWNEHYQEQYKLSFRKFINDENSKIQNAQEASLKNYVFNNKKSSHVIEKKEKISNVDKNKVLQSKQYLNSISYCLQMLKKRDHLLEENRKEHSSVNEIITTVSDQNGESQPNKNPSVLSDSDFECYETRIKNKVNIREMQVLDEKDLSAGTALLEISDLPNKELPRTHNIKKALTLMGFSIDEQLDEINSGFVKYIKKNIRKQNKRLKLNDVKPKTHIFFDDENSELESSYESQCLNDIQSHIEGNNVKEINIEFLNCETYLSSLKDVDYLDSEYSEFKMPKAKKVQNKKTDRLPQEIMKNKNLLKYWLRRYELFSLFDQGIQLDTESWFSVTPEKLAEHHAERCRCDVLIDAFCGAGGNAIQFAFICEKVIAIDIDPKKIEMAKNNARVYGVEERIEFIVGDFIKLACNLRADVVFLSPPWGGPEYNNKNPYNLSSILSPLGGKGLFQLASQITNDIAFFLPKNANPTELSLLSGPGGKVEIEQNFMNQRLRSVTAYFGELIMNPDDPYL